jgi:arylsulfatase
MVRCIKRRDPTRPAFWYLSYRHPHPPLAPLAYYLELYRQMALDEPLVGEWAEGDGDVPWMLAAARRRGVADGTPAVQEQLRLARAAFYALCTHIDHQLRVVIGTLREEGLLQNTIVCFTSDHGDMLGKHRLWAKRLFYEESANVPMILLGPVGDDRVGVNQVDTRLAGWQDVMPTLLELAGLEVPASVEGVSMIGEVKRKLLYGEFGEVRQATRMIRKGRYKLIYYAAGNVRQLFDLDEDPEECYDLVDLVEHDALLQELTAALVDQLYGSDMEWLQNGVLVGLPSEPFVAGANRGLTGQRGGHWPPAPHSNMAQF